MAIDVTWLGHGTWSVAGGGKRILIDPFLDDSPSAPIKSDKIAADYILVSHGHSDHVADCVKIAKRTKATVIASFEICQWLSKQGVKGTIGHNLGGGSNHDFGRVKLTIAHHSSALPDGSYGGNPCGFLLTIENKNLYFACDTGLFSDMKLIGECGLELAVVPIGDLFTMGPDDAIIATRLLAPRKVAPSHYNTWPPIAQDAAKWASRVKQETSAEPIVVKPGESFAI